MSEVREELRKLLKGLVQRLTEYEKMLDELEPGSKEWARAVDGFTKLLNLVRKYEHLLSEEEKDLVQLLSEKSRLTTVKSEGITEANVEAARYYLRLAIRELGGEP
jgi:acyl-CoA reductase-like NAD-dependent aldehyde dehydrogenase